MAKKYEPSAEELKNLMAAYDSCGTYSGAARAVGLSVAVATRIIKENIDKKEPVKVESAPPYCGPEPGEPYFEGIVNLWNKDESWKAEYAE